MCVINYPFLSFVLFFSVSEKKKTLNNN